MCGTALFLASTVQQLGLYFGASAGKAGFLTSCYIIIVPLLGLFFKKTCGWNIWASCLSSFQTWIPLLYAGIMSCGVAYTLQIVAQDGLNPTLASLLMSLESVFSVIAGWLILKESMGIHEISGCAIMFIAIILAQLPLSSKYKS